MIFDETVFITGFPGFIAGRLFERLALAGARLLFAGAAGTAERARQDLERITNRQTFRQMPCILAGDITAKTWACRL